MTKIFLHHRQQRLQLSHLDLRSQMFTRIDLETYMSKGSRPFCLNRIRPAYKYCFHLTNIEAYMSLSLSSRERRNLTFVKRKMHISSGLLSSAELLRFLHCYMYKNLILYKYRRLINGESLCYADRWLRQLKHLFNSIISCAYKTKVARSS